MTLTSLNINGNAEATLQSARLFNDESGDRVSRGFAFADLEETCSSKNGLRLHDTWKLLFAHECAFS